MKTPRVSDIVGIINKIAPFALAEEWDNVGLQVGDSAAPVERIMVALDPASPAVPAAVAGKCQLLLTHHPFLFTPLKKISLTDPVGRLLALAIKNDLAIVSLHTNYDIADGGLNDLLAARLGVEGCEPLKATGTEELLKLSVFVPKGHEEKVLEALFRFSGFIGNYSDCSFRSGGIGTFRPLDGAQPFLGKIGRRESVEESRIELLLRKGETAEALNALRKAHPYEEPAFDLYPLLNRGKARGLGRIGALPQPATLGSLAASVKDKLGAQALRMVGDPDRPVKKVALCGGSGGALVRDAHFKGADVLVTGDVRYHEAREAEVLGMAILDAGHFATEAVMVEGVAALLRAELKKKGHDAEVVAFQGEREPFTCL